MTAQHPASNPANGEPAGPADLGPKKPKRKGGPKDISPSTGDSPEPDPSGGEGPAQTPEGAHTEQEQEPKVDGDLGVSRDINDEQATADNLPATIGADNAKLPASYERAKLALAECESIDECKDWEDKAAALAAYGRMAGDTELEKYALRIRAHAARRAGELLDAIPRETGGRPRKKYSGGHSPEFSNASLE